MLNIPSAMFALRCRAPGDGFMLALRIAVAKTTLSVLLGEPYVNVDDTKLKVLDKTHRRGRYLGHLWCIAGPRKLIAYLFTETWSADDIAPYLGAIDGFIQCDDYKGYSSKVELPDGSSRILVPPDRRLGCMMHVRRRFHDALKLGDKRAAEPIAFIRELYAIEAEAKEAGMDADARLGEACNYALAQRAFVRRCFSDGRFEIDNGLVERAIREPGHRPTKLSLHRLREGRRAPRRGVHTRAVLPRAGHQHARLRTARSGELCRSAPT